MLDESANTKFSWCMYMQQLYIATFFLAKHIPFYSTVMLTQDLDF